MNNDEYWRGFFEWLSSEGLSLPETEVRPKPGTRCVLPHVSLSAGAPGFYYAFSRDEKQYGVGAIAVAFVIKGRRLAPGSSALEVARVTMNVSMLAKLTNSALRKLEGVKEDEFVLYLVEPNPSADCDAQYRWFVDQLPLFQERFDYWVRWLARR